MRRHARAGRHQSRHWPDREPQRRGADHCPGRRHQPRAFVEKYDPGMPAGRDLAAGYAALLAFAEAQSIPVAHTMSGKGGIACTHPLSVGLFGRYSRIANELIEASDCLVVIGCKLGEIATKRYALPPQTIPLIHLDIVAEEIGRCRTAEVALWGDARAGLEDLADALADETKRARAARADYAAEIPSRMASWREEAAARLHSE